MTYCIAAENVLRYEHKQKTSRADARHIIRGSDQQSEVTTMSTNSDSTHSADSRQLSIFTPQFDERIRSLKIDGVMYFSVLDIFEHYGSKGSESNPRKYWARAKALIEKQPGDVVTGLMQHKFPGQGSRETPIATHATIQAIADLIGLELGKERNEVPASGYVYVLHFEQFPNEYKIGIAINLENRMRTYRTENPPSISMIVDCTFYYADCLAVEKELHAALKEYRLRGEWFNLTADQIPTIKQWLAGKGIDIMTSRALLDGRVQ